MIDRYKVAKHFDRDIADGLSYEEAEAKAGLPPVVDFDPAIMAEYATPRK